MRILSWDVGIKNLAYCLINKNDSDAKIEDWGIINLMEDVDKKCYGFINSDEKRTNCNRKCTHYFQNGGNTHYFCMIHKNQYSKIHRETLEMNAIKTKDKCQIHKNNGEQCTKKGVFEMKKGGKKQLVCNYHSKHILKKHNANTIKNIIKTNANKAPIDPILIRLIQQLNKNETFLHVDYVLIENQPSLKNPKMKNIASTLKGWFLTKGIVDRVKNSEIQKVLYLSPSNKLKINDDDIQKEINKLKKSKQYAFTKKMAITKTNSLIKNDEKWMKFLNNNTKKDDLCDSYLQGLYFLNNFRKFIKE